MGDSKIAKIPYDERTDDQKLASNWKKAAGQFEREEWSASVVRVATSAEISANIYIRHFLIDRYALPSSYVDELLFSANGLEGKFNKLVRPAAQHLGTWNDLRRLKTSKIEVLHKHRNGVVHAGKFKSKADAKSAFALSLAIITALAPDQAVHLRLPYEG
ncbi:hypothetical protein H9L17_04830 [Thermomonas brevis]|uniref:Apea-like HEPN domain-containing protein n=1 Tax=Thermomonas brevis TaxID=215691 RepID=A0A7G9QVU1_9GAMM|nr:hypothetical protein [Thermomonas brevis]QNN47466.1 hypothetical protein H9L17_04830 [Thermomonas brevis]